MAAMKWHVVFFLAGATLAATLPGCSSGVSKAVTLTTANFEDKVLKSKQIVLVDFWAEWCGPCKAMDPVIKELAAEYEGRAVVGKVNIDDYPGVAAKYEIVSIPTLLVFKDGVLKRKIVGMQSHEYLRSQLVAMQ